MNRSISTSTIEHPDQLARAVLPTYEVDDGPLSEAQLRAVREAAKGSSESVKASLFQRE